MIYFDNSASTYTKPKEVIKAVYDGITRYTGNPGRSGHSISLDSAIKINECRENVCNFVNCDKSEHVIFTENCTDALNLAILGTFRENGHVICSCNDHNSLSRPLFELKKKGLEVSVATPKNGHTLTKEDILPLIKSNTYMVAINHMSNVNGDVADIRDIGGLCAEKCLLFLVDAAQSAGHLNIDMQKNYIDMLALAPHKGLYAPQGIGVLAFSPKAKILPIRYGGTGTESINLLQPTESPECYESGTLPTLNIMGLNAGLNFVKNNYNSINAKIEDLSTYILFELSKIEGVKTYTYHENSNGVIGFNIKNYESSGVCQILSDKYKICLRGGLHCAALKHTQLKTVEQGICRCSISYFNNFTECEKLIRAIKEIAST